jgi:hypothetical protein
LEQKWQIKKFPAAFAEVSGRDEREGEKVRVNGGGQLPGIQEKNQATS